MTVTENFIGGAITVISVFSVISFTPVIFIVYENKIIQEI
jgi:hypothetical protein